MKNNWDFYLGKVPTSDESKIGGISCVYIRRKKILLVKHANKSRGRGFVAGHREKGETKIETLIRESKEEAGIDRIEKVWDFGYYKIQDPTNLENHSYVTVYTGIVNPQDISDRTALKSEIVDQRFFPVSEIKNIFPPQYLAKEVVKQACLHQKIDIFIF